MGEGSKAEGITHEQHRQHRRPHALAHQRGAGDRKPPFVGVGLRVTNMDQSPWSLLARRRSRQWAEGAGDQQQGRQAGREEENDRCISGAAL